jgi:phosphoglycolate phosphatase-like HAD superfamily hydrolase
LRRHASSTRVLALDLDGTLLDCRRRQVELARHVAPALDGRRFWAAKRMGATTRAALAAQGIEDETAAAAWSAAIEDPEWLRLDAVLPGAVAAVERARAAAREPLVLTARRDAAAVREQVSRSGLPARVLVVDPRRAAPEKAAALRELAAVGLVGDTESDAAAAREAGVAFAAVGSGQRDPRFLEERGIRPVYDGVLAAVTALLDGLQTT